MKFFVALALLCISTGSFAAPTSKRMDNGNFYASVSIGIGVNEDGTLKLRNTLKDIFLKRQGGYYQHAFDISDYLPNKEGTLEVSRAEFDNAFEKLNVRLERFQRRNPLQERTVVLSLTGHGLTDGNGKFSFAINHNEDLPGRELVNIIENIKAEKIIFIMQSCQSGSVANGYFTQLVEEIKANVKTSAKIKGQGKSFAVITPVNRYVNSPVYLWERILRNSFKDITDTNKNERISIEEWFNAIRKRSVRNVQFSSKMVWDDKLVEEHAKKINLKQSDYVHISMLRQVLSAGIDPQMFSFNFDARETMFLTRKGASQLAKGTLAPMTLANRGPELKHRHTIYEKNWMDAVFKLLDLMIKTQYLPEEKRATELQKAFADSPREVVVQILSRIFGANSEEVRMFGSRSLRCNAILK